jgi:hypothetical protein
MVRTALFLFLVLVFSPARGQSQGTDAETFFELKIRPVLAGTCFKCHGGKKVSHGLRVNSRDALLKGGDSGPAIISGDAEKSLLIQALRYTHEEIKMPPDKPLPDAVVADFAAWVQQGAAWPKNTSASTMGFDSQRHWAFQRVEKLNPPRDLSGWSDHPIDRFIMAKMSEQGIKPVAPTDKRTLIRRATFDLIGLPPTPDEVESFLRDDSPLAYAKLVERLLASPHYGERWGRHWMDVARYADTAGDNADYPIPEARRYRDYIIDSFNADKPYDQFVQEQLAGDILAKKGPREKYAERVVATGFLALSRRYATAPYELWHLTMEDTIDTVGRAFLGLTLRCARCHDHKFDPVTRDDYYALYGIFASTRFPFAGAEEFASKQEPRRDFIPLLPPDEAALALADHVRRIKEIDESLKFEEKHGPLAQRLGEIDRQIEALTKSIPMAESTKANSIILVVERALLQKQREAVERQLQAKLKQLRHQHQALVKPGLPAELPGAYAVQDGKPVEMYIHIRGEVDEHGPVVKRNAPKFLAEGQSLTIPEGQSGRLQLAEWLTRPDHPLTARVMVNRIWQHHFGKGLVATPSNFGIRGEQPTHPELLDWLAARFVECGWSVKVMDREIVTSKTYQLASCDDEPMASKDPSNRWCWRFDRRRLDAEAIRDALLAVSGQLKRSRPGAHPFPPIDQWNWTQHYPFKENYPTDHRSVYLMTQRFQRHPYLALFDGPDTNTSTAQRRSSTVPLQALFLMNNRWMVERAEGLAGRLIQQSNDGRHRIELAHQLAWSRPAHEAELKKGIQYIANYQKLALAAGIPTDRVELEAWTSYSRILLSANEFFYVD